MMSLRSRYNKLLTSSIARLTDMSNKTVGMRVKIYDIELDKFLYFDFSTSIVSAGEIKNFLKENLSSFIALPLCKEFVREEIVNGEKVKMRYTMTQEEYDNKLVISEFKSESEANIYLTLMMEIYKWKDNPLEY